MASLGLILWAKDESQAILKAFGGRLERLAEKGRTDLVKLSAAAQTLAPTFAVAGAGMVAGLGVALKTAADFEQTMSGVKAVMAPQEVKEFGGALEKLALQLGKETAFSAKAAAAGIEELVKGGLSAQDILGGAAKSTLALAAAGGVSLPEAATIAANAMAQFSLSGEEFGHAADLIAGAANASAISVGDFKFSLAASGAVASTVGFSFDDLAQAIAVMGKAGIVGSDAGTSLKTMMLNLQPSTKEQIGLFQQLGLLTEAGGNAFFDASGKVKSMADVAGILQGALAGMTDQQRIATLETMFGSDAIRAGAVLSKAGAQGFDEMASAMGKVTAEAVGAARLDNLSGSLEQLKGSAETVAITIGQQLIPIFRPLVDGVTGLVNKFLDLSPEWQKVITFAALTVTGLTLFAGAALALLAVLPAVIGGIAAAGTILAVVGGILTGPLLLAIAGVVLAIVGLKLAWETNFLGIRDLVGAAWDVLAGVFSQIGDALAAFGAEVLPEARLAWEAMTARVREVWTALVDFLQPALAAFGRVWQSQWDGIREVLVLIWQVMKTLVGVSWDLLTGVILAGLKVLQGDWAGAWEVLRERLASAWERIKALVAAAVDFIGERVRGLVAPIQEVVSQINRLLGGIRTPDFGGLVERARGAAETIGGILPRFAAGGLVPGPVGAATLAVVHGGERVLTPAQQRAAGAGLTVQYFQQAPVYGFNDFEDSVVRAVELAKRRGRLD